MISGCIREVNTVLSHREGELIENVTLENSQACAEHCASMEGALFWTFFTKTKTCLVKNTTVPWRGGSYDTLSGNRACGLSKMAMAWQDKVPLVPLRAVASQEEKDFPPRQCADGNRGKEYNRGQFCVVPASPAPWIALDFGSKVRVDRVDISVPGANHIESQTGIRSSKTLRDYEVRVTDSLPSSGSYSSCVL